MMETDQKKHFAIICTTDMSNQREGQRLVVMRKFLKEGLKPNIKILHEVAMPDYTRIVLIVIVDACSEEAVETAIEFCSGIFHTDVSEVLIKHDAYQKERQAKYAVFALNTPIGKKTESTINAENYSEIELWLEFSNNTQLHDVLLLNTPTFATAHYLGAELVPGAVTETQYCESLHDLFNRKTEPSIENLVPALPEDLESVENSDALISEGGFNAVYAIMGSGMPFDASMKMNFMPKDHLTKVSGPAMIWPYPGHVKGASFSFSVNWSWVNNFWPPNYDYTTAANWGVPSGVIPSGNNGIVYEFNIRDGVPISGSVRSPMSIWLNDLMLTDKYKQSWPEDSYTGGKLNAYNFILSKLPGQTPPKKGTLKQTGPIIVIDYPDGANFTKQEFKEVKDHLILEVGYFVTADNWFGINGIMDAINRGVAVLSANDLTEAANYMQIPVKTTSLEMILDNIFRLIFGLLSAIPIIGSALSAYCQISWFVVKESLQKGVTSRPIQAVIAEIADRLNDYLITLETSAEVQRLKLYNDWGKLEEFSQGVVTGIISEKMFLGDAQLSDDIESRGATKKLQERVQASVADAWLLYCYQQLFTVAHQVAVTVSFSQNIPNNPWAPDKNNYHYTWYVPCIYPDSKSKEQPGYMVLDCQTDAPAVVMQQFFGISSRLGIVPIEFFAGLSGWLTGLPTYYAGYQNLTGHAPPVPVKQIGLKSWGDVLSGQKG